MAKIHRIPLALRAAYLSMHRLTNSLLLPHGVTADQFVCLVVLEEEDGITQQEIVRRSTSDPNTVRAMLIRLEKRGLVAREKHPTDGRARHVTITTKGRELLDILVIAGRPVRELLTKELDVDETNTLHEYLIRITSRLQK